MNLHPQITLKPVIQKSKEIYESVLSGELDFGFITSYSSHPKDSLPEVNTSIVKEYELMCCIAKNNPVYSMLHLEDGILMEQDYPLLNQLTLSVSSIPMIRKRILEDLVISMDLHPRQVVINDSLELWAPLLAINHMYGFWPYSHMDDSIAQIPLHFHPNVCKLLIYPKGIRMAAPQKQMIRMVIKEFKDRPYYYNI